MKIITADNYYEPDEYMSVSAYKKFLHCEVDGLKGFSDERSEALLIGSYVDAYVEGTLEAFKEKTPELFLKIGANKGELKTPFKYADDICEFITRDKVFSQFMSGEKQTVMTGQIAGIPFKIKMDSYSKGIAINDLKVMRTVTDRNGNFYDFISPWGYDIQLASYQDIVYQNTGEKLLCYICAVTKEKPINSVIINIPQNFLDRALYGVQEHIERFYKVKMGELAPVGCGICDVCISNRTQTPIISMLDLLE